MTAHQRVEARSKAALAVEEAMPQGDRTRFLTWVAKSSPQLSGAKVADVLDIYDNHDELLDWREPFTEKHGAALDTALGINPATVEAAGPGAWLRAWCLTYATIAVAVLMEGEPLPQDVIDLARRAVAVAEGATPTPWPHGSVVEQVHRLITTDQGVDPWVLAEEIVKGVRAIDARSVQVVPAESSAPPSAQETGYLVAADTDTKLPSLPAGVYRHYKGPLYLVFGYGHDANADTLGVVHTAAQFTGTENEPLRERNVVVYVGLQLDAAHTGPRLAVRDVADFHAWVCGNADCAKYGEAVIGPDSVCETCEWTPIRRFAYLAPEWGG